MARVVGTSLACGKNPRRLGSVLKWNDYIHNNRSFVIKRHTFLLAYMYAHIQTLEKYQSKSTKMQFFATKIQYSALNSITTRGSQLQIHDKISLINVE